MPSLKLKNIYMKDETGKGYKKYDEVIVEYQDNGDDEKFAKIVSAYTEGKTDVLDTYDKLAEDMIISPEEFKEHKNFGKNAAAITQRLLPFLLRFGNEDMIESNKELEIEEIDGQ
ncbi:hypothetical protein [Leptotrichia trevisanii]|uniref:hypothetical protein n=1 Tax=Leptotrichia trevisanii TaxID=109328 RepID=UPI0026E9DBBD|nr:hypothetical protein [Leptotrichia trevisanii]